MYVNVAASLLLLQAYCWSTTFKYIIELYCQNFQDVVTSTNKPKQLSLQVFTEYYGRHNCIIYSLWAKYIVTNLFADLVKYLCMYQVT